MQKRVLGQTGFEVSILGYGASALGGVFGAINEKEGLATVHRALDLGINLIDCSPYYGQTKAETVLGKALSTVPRDNYYLATKVGRYGDDEFDFSAARVTRSVDKSLKRLQVETIDIIQCHDIEFGDLAQIVNETIPALRRVVQSGKARFVGITGLPLQIFTRVADQAPVDTILSYCRYNLNDTSLQEITPFLQQKGIGVISASPFAMGLLIERGAPDWHPAPPTVKETCARAVNWCRDQGVSIEKLAVQFAVSNPQIASCLVGTANPTEIAQDVKWAQEPLDEDLLAAVRTILTPILNRTWRSGRAHKNDNDNDMEEICE